MLRTIENYSLDQRAVILSQLTRSLGPMGETDDWATKLDPALREQLLEELREKTGVARDDYSEQASVQMAEIISQELNYVTLDAESSARIRRHLGQEGLLRNDFYKPTFWTEPDNQTDARPGALEEALKYVFGVTKEEITAAIAMPDVFSHLHPVSGDASVARVAALSLFVKKLADSTILVHGRRNGDEINILSAWRLFHDEFELTGQESPMEVLTLFLDKFGITVHLRGPGRKLIAYQELDPPLIIRDVLQPGLDRIPGRYWCELVSGVDRGSNRASFVAMLFVVHVSRYVDYLRKHGIQLPDPPSEVPF